MAKAGTIHVDIQATTQQLQAGLKSAEAQVAASTKRMASTSRAVLGGAAGGIAVGGGFADIRRGIMGFGLIAVITQANRIWESMAESSGKIAMIWKSNLSTLDKIAETSGALPFIGTLSSSISDSIIGGIGALGRAAGSDAIGTAFQSKGDLAAQDAFGTMLRGMLEEAKAQVEVQSAFGEIGKINAKERQALTRLNNELNAIIEQINLAQAAGMSIPDAFHDLIKEIATVSRNAILNEFSKQRQDLIDANMKKADGNMRPGIDEFGTSLGRVRFMQNTDFTPLAKPATESTAKSTAAATKQAAGTLTQILSRMVQSGNVGFA